MDERLKELSERLVGERGGRSGRGMRYSADLKHDVLNTASQCREAGRPVSAVARSLGVRSETLRRWLLAAEDPKGFRMVKIRRPAAADRIAIVSPLGFRVEGLDLTGAATLLRLLG